MGLEEKLSDPQTIERTTRWQARFTGIKNYSVGLVRYLDSLKDILKDKAGYTFKEKNYELNEGNKKSVNEVLLRNGEGKVLYQKIKAYKKNILELDEGIKDVFEKRIVIAGTMFEDENTTLNFSNTLFANKTVIEVLTLLNQFKHAVLDTECQLLTYCNYQTNSYSCGYEKFEAIVAQSSKYVKQGDYIDISAGIGAFNTASSPKISINGKNVLVDVNGVANYTLKAASKPGKHFVPVRIDYVKADGTSTSESHTLEYVVSKDATY
ncbi:hypothetical protein GCM10027043_14470 [Ferruginibacter profundus]